MVLLGIFCVIYLIFPTLGVFEVLPDYLPFVGSLDEASVTVLLIAVLNYFGIDVKGFLGKKDDDKNGREVK